MTPTDTTTTENRSSEEIAAEIRETRGRMDATIDELGSRLNARSLVNSALDWWDSPESGNKGSEALKHAAVAIGHGMKEHPVPTLLIGAGIAWLVMDRDSDGNGHGPREGDRFSKGDDYKTLSGRDYSIETNADLSSGESGGIGIMERVRSTATGAKEKLSSAKDKLADAKDRISGTAHHAADEVREKAHLAMERSKSTTLKARHGFEHGWEVSRDRFTRGVEQHPLALGLGFVALGALAGVLLPRTSKEDELMGEKSDELIEAAKDKGGELLEKGKVVGGQVAEAAMEGAREQGLTVDAAKEKISEIASKAGEVISKAKEEAATAAERQGLTPNVSANAGRF